MNRKQAANSVMMIRPDGFGYNPETAASNSFQKTEGSEDIQRIKDQASQEFEGLVSVLKSVGVEVIVFNSVSEEKTPDAVFPNNWVSFHPDGKVILYPMMATNRRLERRLEYITALGKQFHFEVNEIIDLSYFEEQGLFLEGTGSMVIDYSGGIIYANLSPRTSAKVLHKVAAILGYELIQFHATDRHGLDIYHTNVLMCVGSTYAVVCMEALPDPKSRYMLKNSLSSHGHEIVDISFHQMEQFAGNMMELESMNGESILAMSTAAFQSLSDAQKQILTRHSELVHAPIETIEKYGGGSVRCMLAGIFLPKEKPSLVNDHS